jgi:hypothetical protein
MTVRINFTVQIGSEKAYRRNSSTVQPPDRRDAERGKLVVRTVSARKDCCEARSLLPVSIGKRGVGLLIRVSEFHYSINPKRPLVWQFWRRLTAVVTAESGVLPASVRPCISKRMRRSIALDVHASRGEIGDRVT